VETLTPDQAYLAMFDFLATYFQRGRSEEIGALLGALSQLADGGPADPACARDWATAVKRALAGDVAAELALPQRQT
jgi:hypothetical protein